MTEQLKRHILFPFVRQQMAVVDHSTFISKPHFGTVQNPIQVMMHEHDIEGQRFRKIANLTNNYTPPADACNTYKIAFKVLKEFEEDLHRHIHCTAQSQTQNEAGRHVQPDRGNALQGF